MVLNVQIHGSVVSSHFARLLTKNNFVGRCDARKEIKDLFARASLSNGESNQQQKKHENPEKFTACTHKLNRDSGPTSSERKTTNIIPIRIVSSQNVKIIPKNSLHTHEKKWIESNFIFIKAVTTTRKKSSDRSNNTWNKNTNILWHLWPFASHMEICWRRWRGKKSTKKYTDTACVRSNDSGTVYQINSLVSGFNLWSLRHTVALVLILIEDITFHYQIWCRENVLHRISDSK